MDYQIFCPTTPCLWNMILAVDIYAGVAASLAERKKGGQLTEFFRNIKGTIDDEDWDQVLFNLFFVGNVTMLVLCLWYTYKISSLVLFSQLNTCQKKISKLWKKLKQMLELWWIKIQIKI